MLRPDSHLKGLIAAASPEQSARAVAKAKDYYTMCLRLGIAPADGVRVLKEALEMELSGVADVPDAGKERPEYTRRRYSQNYNEP